MSRNRKPLFTDQPARPALEEAELQKTHMRRVRQKTEQIANEKGRPLKGCVVTFGCQMNARDSEKLRGVLEECGFEQTDNEKEADLILFNTCTIREHADQHLYGRLGEAAGLKKKNPDLIIGLCGCMMQEEQIVRKIRSSYPAVSLIFGTHNLFTLPMLLDRVLEEKRRVIELWNGTDMIVEDLPSKRKYPFKAGVNITFGCNNFCSYCIVPYVRGRERSRDPEEILKEVRSLAADGVKEIMLLGQNVNSYRGGEGPEGSFPGLLEAVCRVDGIERIRFMTSHPKDLSDELIEVIARNEKICRHIHLPVQSGSSRILEKMNRRYTREHYLDLVAKIRKAIPDVSLTTDLIVAFPGETEEDFQDTLTLVDEVGFDSVFTFIYSVRNGTPAATMPDQIPEDVAHERFDRLLTLVQKRGQEMSSRFEGQTLPVLVEEKNRTPGMVTGRTSHNLTVHFEGDESLIGKIVPVYLAESRGFYYFGKMR